MATELLWTGRHVRRSCGTYALQRNREKQCGDDPTPNMLVHGDGAKAMTLLAARYAGLVKCVCIDPPYNTGGTFAHYVDNMKSPMWLSMMLDQVTLHRTLLSEEGSLWIMIDDNEMHYLKVLCDEVFGRKNFVANIVWQKKFAPQNDAKFFSTSHDHILVYAKNIERLQLNLLPRTAKMDGAYQNPDNDPRGPWRANEMFRMRPHAKGEYAITTPGGRVVTPPPGKSWLFNEERIPELMRDNRLDFGKNGNGIPRIKRFLREVRQGLTPQTVWTTEDVGSTQEAKKEMTALSYEDIFDTPKPERLIHRILTLATSPGERVLDSFLGSGTTAAVAHKMGRPWIGIEHGVQCDTHCLPRLRRVCGGTEPGGVTGITGWRGGGGFRYLDVVEKKM